MGIFSKLSNWVNGDDDEDLDEEYDNYVYDEEDEDDEEDEKPSVFARLKARFIRSDDEIPTDDEDEDDYEEPAPAAKSRPTSSYASNTRLNTTLGQSTASTARYQSAVAQRERNYTNTVARQATAAGQFSHTTTNPNAAYPQKTPLVPSPERTASLNAAANAPQKQFSVMKPTSFEDSSSIVDVLRNGKAIIVNFEGFNPAIAQRIMDFVCGCIYTIDGQILQISGYIFIVAPKDVDITGDYTAFLQQDAFGVPTFRQ